MKIPEDIFCYGDKSYRGVCPTETQEIIVFFHELRLRHPKLALVARHTRNEGKRSLAQGRYYKRQGLVTGSPDVIIGGLLTCEIEFKRRDPTKSSISEAQLDCLRAAKANGSFVAIALGAEAGMRAVERWMKHAQKLEAALMAHGLTKENGYGSRALTEEQSQVAHGQYL